MPYQDDKFEATAIKDKFLSSEIGSRIIDLCIEIEEARKEKDYQEKIFMLRAELWAFLEFKGYI